MKTALNLGGDGPVDKSSTQEMKWTEAIEFLLRMASTGDPKELREWQRLRLIDDLRRFLEAEGPGEVARQLEEARSNPTLLVPVIEIVRQLANAAADHERAEVKVGPTRIVFDGSRKTHDRVAPVFVDGLLSDVVVGTAASDFGEAEPWQIGRCRWRECHKLFLADRKGQIFCSHKCANAASSDSYQKRKAKASRGAEKRGGRPPKKKSARGGK